MNEEHGLKNEPLVYLDEIAVTGWYFSRPVSPFLPG